MKRSHLLFILLLLSNSLFSEYKGSNFSGTWHQVTSDEYTLPHNEISFGYLLNWGVNEIKNSATRTLSDHSDALPYFTKLVHPNGICLSGKWRIMHDNPYGGYFKQGSEALIIARASVALNETTKGHQRAFGFAGKLFPTTDSDDVVQTANFFLIDDLGGTSAEHYTSVAMTNEPASSITLTVVRHLIYSIKLAVTFGEADSNPGIRQLYEVSYLGEENTSTVRTPRWMKVQALPGQTVNAEDFRDELNVDAHGGEIKFSVSVASSQDSRGRKNWSEIGEIILDASVVSNSCDHRLHFHHPKWKSNLRY